MTQLKSDLTNTLSLIETHDPSSQTFNPRYVFETNQEYYDYRNGLIYEAVMIARALGYKSGFNVHTPVQDMIDKGWDHTWGVVANIELPTGLVSWHIESPDIKYDGHDYIEKESRIKKYVEGVK